MNQECCPGNIVLHSLTHSLWEPGVTFLGVLGKQGLTGGRGPELLPPLLSQPGQGHNGAPSWRGPEASPGYVRIGTNPKVGLFLVGIQRLFAVQPFEKLD